MASRHYTRAEAVEALQCIDPGCDRVSWVKAMAGAKAAGLEFDHVHSWSATAPNYKGERDVMTTWRSINERGAVRAGTLFHMARANGWKPQQDANRPAPKPSHTPRAQAPAKRPTQTAADVWAAGVPATLEHGYIARKGGQADGLRACAGGLRIAGHDMTGALLVPVRTLAGELVSLQAIPADGPKMNLPGHPMQGVFVVGNIEGRAFVVEGIGQAWACWRATGHAAVVAFGWGRVAAVTKELRAAHPGLTLVVVPDAGKEADAERIAKETGAQWVVMPAGSPANFDANDYMQAHGADELELLLEQTQAPAQRFKFLSADELVTLPPMQWLVRGVLPQSGVACMYGPSGSGKSFLGIDLGEHIAGGRWWFGRRVKQAPVVYCALEGEHGLAQRVQAMQRRRGALPKALRFIAQPFALLDDAQALADAIKAAGAGGGVVVIDTLNRAASGIDENTAADMGRVIDACKALQSAIGGLVLLVHHTGKDLTRGLRGHSSLYAALDAAIEVTRSDTGRAWKVAKSKDGEDEATHAFRLEVETIGTDEHGDPVTSCVVVPDTTAKEVKTAKLPRGGNQRLVLEALRPLFKTSHDLGKGGAPEIRPCLELEAVLPVIRNCLAVAPEKRTSRTREAITGLVSRNVLGLGDGWIWLA